MSDRVVVRPPSSSAAERARLVALIYAVFLLSGAAALVYQVIWTRSLSLVFGGSHLAVTTVLAAFMGGLALGGHLVGRRIAHLSRLLRIYGLFELGIAASAIAFAVAVRFYPAVYVPLARLGEDSPAYLSVVRVAFAVAVLIVPTTLMGGTLPLLAAFVGGRGRDFGARLSFLYGFNTLGAVAGAGLAGFVLLPRLSVSATLAVAVGINVLLGALCMAWSERAERLLAADAPAPGKASAPQPIPAAGADNGPLRLVLWGIGVSGFCALGYEVLWTRVLSLVIGASVYGFTVMLMAFLAGIALGSAAYGAWRRARPAAAAQPPNATRGVVAFALVQIAIGGAALAVTHLLRDLPAHALALQAQLLGTGADFGARQGVDFALAFLYMLVPAFLMGVAFPMAARLRAERTGAAGRAVGETLSFNTVGAIFGAAASGLLLVHLFGVERSLQLLVLVNVGCGLVVLASCRRRPALTAAVAAALAGAAVALAAAGDSWRSWDRHFFAVFQSNRPDKFSSARKIRDTLRNTEVLYYAEGAHALVSSIRVRGGTQSFLTNGRIEATDNPPDLACQLTLGHLPMLLHPDPKSVFVLGTGSGMTLGATSIHPGVERLTLAEIEPAVLGVARTFARYNHGVLDDPRLRLVLNDGRNFLLTTRERFDVVTADPIHPWFSGAGYLYTKEYFDLAASRLNPGGVMCQWLPIYELDKTDLRSIVRTFAGSFEHVLVWLTHYDAHLVGSDAPFAVDEAVLARRIDRPAIRDDLRQVEMGSARDLLEFFLMGDAGVARYAAGARINTDDNLFLEFSAPHSIENAERIAANFSDLVAHRESPLPYLRPADDAGNRATQAARADDMLRAAAVVDPLRARYLAGDLVLDEMPRIVAELDPAFESYAPWRFLRGELASRLTQAPRLVAQRGLPAIAANGAPVEIRLGAVTRRLTSQISTVDFVDGRDGRVFAHLELLGEDAEARAAEAAAIGMNVARDAYLEASRQAGATNQRAPREEELLTRLELRLNATSEADRP
ncbi:MAG: fused MFS/spermidine synthase [Thermoanaerobaculia bacterium]|nr:fused MFS/spermidine synthase [Thermoanaerobaculia bacterium]